MHSLLLELRPVPALQFQYNNSKANRRVQTQQVLFTIHNSLLNSCRIAEAAKKRNLTQNVASRRTENLASNGTDYHSRLS